MSDMRADVERLKTLYHDLESLYDVAYSALQEILEKAKGQVYTQGEMVDLGFFCREMEVLCDDLRKESKAKKDFFGKLICHAATEATLNSQGAIEPVPGQYATGRPDMKPIPAIPKFGTDEYWKLCDYFEIPKDMQRTGCVQFHFRHLQTLIEQLIRQGKNPPDGIQKTYPDYKTVFVRKKTA